MLNRKPDFETKSEGKVEQKISSRRKGYYVCFSCDETEN